MGRRRSVPQALLPFLIVLMAAAGCAGAGGPAAVEGTGGSGDASGSGESTPSGPASTREDPPEHPPRERTGQGHDRPRFVEESRAEAAYFLGGAYVPAGFGEGSLWATDILTCDDTGEAPPPGEYDGGEVAAACAAPASTSLKRLDPETGEEEATVELDDFFANVTEVAFGAGSVWFSSADVYPGPA